MSEVAIRGTKQEQEAFTQVYRHYETAARTYGLVLMTLIRKTFYFDHLFRRITIPIGR